ncbi:MAG: HRDC domain-containing protein [Bacteroidota bacterium]
MENSNIKNRKVNITEDAITILKTVMLFDQPYGMNYLARILLGSKDYGFKNEMHTELETFGLFKEVRIDRIRDLINYLIKKEFLFVSNKRYGIIAITQGGENFLDKPETLEVLPRYLYTNRHDRRLYKVLRSLRKELASQEGKPPFHIFTDYTLQCLVEAKPSTVSELKNIPGIGDYKADIYGQALLKTFEEHAEQKAEDSKTKLIQMANSPSHQEVKALFESGMDIPSIAERRQVQPTTVKSSLYRLHNTGQIDLNPWIEQQVTDSDLEKGTEYFRNSSNTKLKEAYEQLGMDYETLRLCRMYVNKVTTLEEELRYAS